MTAKYPLLLFNCSSAMHLFQWRMSRLVYFAAVSIVAIFAFCLAYVYIEEPQFWRSWAPPRADLGISKARIMEVSNSKSNLESFSDPPPLPMPKRPTNKFSGPSWLHAATSTSDDLASTISTLHKPKDLRVVSVVFYGRRDRSSVLECYLRQNLV